MIQECLCALAVDDSDDVSSTAQDFLECLFSQSWKSRIEHDAAEIFIRFIFFCDTNFTLQLVVPLSTSSIIIVTSF
jgi:hypothetical protein